MGPFAAILPLSNRGFDLQFHLAKPHLTALKTSVSPRLFPVDLNRGERWTRLGLNRLLLALFKVRQVTIGELLRLGVIKFTQKYLKELCIVGFITHKVNKNHSNSMYRMIDHKTVA